MRHHDLARTDPAHSDEEFENWRAEPSRWLAERLGYAPEYMPAPRTESPLDGVAAIATRLRANESRLIATEEAVTRQAQRLQEALARADAAEKRLAETEDLVRQAHDYASEAATRLEQAERRIAETEKRAREAENRAEAFEERATRAETARADIENRAARAFETMQERIAAAQQERDAIRAQAAEQVAEKEKQHEALRREDEARLSRLEKDYEARLRDAEREAQARVFSVQARLDIAEIRLAKARVALEPEATPLPDAPPAAALLAERQH
jgi:chromosome segregation ATPase